MVTLSSCRIWQIISFILPTNEYSCVYAWTLLRQVGLAIDLQKMMILGKKNHLFRWSSFCSWRLCKQAKLSHLGHRKPSRIHWKADAPKTSYEAIVIGPCWINFCSQKLKRRILTTFGFNRTALGATQPKPHLMFYAMFLKIALSAAELMSFGHFGAAISHRWSIIYGVRSKLSVTPTSQWHLTLLRKMYVKRLVKYSCTQSIMCLKIEPIV